MLARSVWKPRRTKDVQKETKSKNPIIPQARIVQDLKKWKGKRGLVAANRSYAMNENRMTPPKTRRMMIL